MVREARTRRGWRPIDLALEMGWSGTAPVYRLERPGPNTPRPTPDTVNLLAQVLELDYADRLTLLGFAGHVPDTEPLTPQEEARLVAWTRPLMEGAAEPVLLFDHRYRVLAFNAAFVRLYGLEPEAAATWRARGVTVFDLLWDQRFVERSGLVDVYRRAEVVMLRFKLDNRTRRHEAWYRAYPGCCAHCPGFVELWERTEAFFARPPAEWDLGRVVQDPLEVQTDDGQRRRFDPTPRVVFGGYGLAWLYVFVPYDDATTGGVAGSG
jgi:hypothetical protein